MPDELMPTSPEREEPVHIAFWADENYLQPLTVAVASLLETTEKPSRLRIWVVSRTLSRTALQAVDALVTDKGATLDILTFNEGDLPRYAPPRASLLNSSYYRLLLPDLLPPVVRRLIYLHCDVVVRRPIEVLWEMDLGDTSTGAVFHPRRAHPEAIGVGHESDYFNSGVLLIDVARWRDQQIGRRALEFAASYPGRLPFHEQDALNHVLNGDWHGLDLRWNQQSRFFKHPSSFLRVHAAALQRARIDPHIVHFTTSPKPWHFGNEHPWRSLYFQYLDLTVHRGWRPPAPGLRARLQRGVRHLVPARWRKRLWRHNCSHLRALKALIKGHA